MITYKGKQYEEFTADKNIMFNPPKRAIFWDTDADACTEVCDDLIAFCPGRMHPAIAQRNSWRHCAILPEPRNATNRELAEWCAQGKGQVHYHGGANVHSFYSYQNEDDDTLVTNDITVRKFGDAEWHKPTTEYLGLTE